MKPRIVVVGAGFGGIEAAKGLGAADAEVTVIDRNNYHLFQPLLYQVATAGLSSTDVAYPIRTILRRHANTTVLMAEVTGIDEKSKSVLTTKGGVPYEYLVLATGSRYNYFGHDEWEPLAPNLKSIPSALDIRQRILQAFENAEAEGDPAERERLMTIVLVGAGPTGVEMAGAIAELTRRALTRDFRRIDPSSARILLVDANPRILTAFPERLAERARVKLESLGVEVWTGYAVKDVDARGVTIGPVRVESATVLWTAGVRASDAGRWLGASTDKSGRVVVNPDLSVPDHPEVFVIGDTALVMDEKGKPLPGVAPVAMQQGRYVAHVIERKISGSPPAEPFRYHDKGNLATIGRAAAIAQFKRVGFDGFFAWLLWVVVHIFYIVSFRNRVLVMLNWALSYVTFQRGARIIPLPESEQRATRVRRSPWRKTG